MSYGLAQNLLEQLEFVTLEKFYLHKILHLKKRFYISFQVLFCAGLAVDMNSGDNGLAFIMTGIINQSI